MAALLNQFTFTLMQESRRPWTKEQDNAVIQIVEEIGLKNWPSVSTLMRQKYNVTGRSGKQCRQRWHNQLNPEVNKKPWTEQEQRLLFQAHKIYRNRWIDISKLFQGRTDNSIKNHFYSTIRRSLRRICKLLGNKNSTSELRNIKPSILSKIFQYSQLKGDQVTQQNEHMVSQSKIITQELLNFARSKPAKSIENFEDVKRRNLQSLIDKLNEFSKNYTSQKDTYCHNVTLKTAPLTNPRVTVLNSQERVSQQENKSQQQSKSKAKNTLNSSNKNLDKKYLYDWQQFQKRCLFVKQIFQNQTQSKGSESPYLEDQGSQCESQSQFPSNIFILEEKESDKAETFVTPRNLKAKGFEPYKSCQIHQTTNLKSEYEAIVEKLKFEITSCASN